MTTKGRLRRSFPGPAITLNHERIAEPSFREALAELLAQLDVDTPIESVPIVSKAGSRTTEIRDTVHPKLVTEMLTGILRGMGQPADIIRTRKRTRDDVLWRNALKPWRRSPLWLLLRVALQTSLAAGHERDHKPYKSFMIFFMARFLDRAVNASLPSDTLRVMAAKISRRALKLSVGDEEPWMQYVYGVVEAAHQEISRRWAAIEHNPDPPGLQQIWVPSRSSFDRDARLSLSNLQPYLDSRPNLVNAPLDDEFVPNCSPRISQTASVLPHTDGTKIGDRLTIMDIELWTQESLDGWLSNNLTSQAACKHLAQLIQDYTFAAGPVYAEGAEDTSWMLLTVMDLWVALDKCAIHQHPLLKEYDSGFPAALFDPLLLPRKNQLERLVLVEQHIQQRKDQATHDSALVFRNIKSNSFSVKYFECSTKHQQLRRRIESAAELERHQKRRELARKTEERNSLLREEKPLSHEQSIEWNGYRETPVHRPSDCRKCQLQRKAADLEIAVHEWPLPQSDVQAKCAVFELDVPTAIAEWRDTTHALLIDVFSPRDPSQKGDKVYSLKEFSGLSGYIQGRIGRLQLGSTAKPFVVAHYRSGKVAHATEESICVNNGLQYSMYDSKFWRRTTEPTCDIWKTCSLQLPSGSYRTLQYAVDKTTHTSNKVIARQSKCPKGLNLHEYYAFATLRSGHRLQWRNIARELTAHILNFSREETYLLVVQAAWQAQCRWHARACREAHADLEEEEFGGALLSVLDEALTTVEGNWQGATAARTFIVLATRLLSLSPHTVVHGGCYLFLRRARHVALRWVRDVSRLLHEEQDPEELKALNLRVLELALICHSTFDVDGMHLSAFLEADEDVAVITECSITIHDRCPAMIRDLPTPLRMLIWRFERLSHSLERHLRRRILHDRKGIDNAIGQVWAGYSPGSCWAAVQHPSQRWIVTKSSADGASSMTVHYNILDGSLLINGTPLTRLPRSYEVHDTYRRLFNEVFDVSPVAEIDFTANLCNQSENPGCCSL